MTTFRGNQLPSWIQWLAQDADGTWWGFEVEPNRSHHSWYENELGRCRKLCQDSPNPDWENSLIPVSDS